MSEDLFNSSWWAGALRQRRELDLAAHDEGRAHQSVDPHAHRRPTGLSGELCEGPWHGADDYELTDWELAWIRDRVIDRHLLAIEKRDAARAFYAVSGEDRHAALLRERAGDHEQLAEQHRATKARLRSNPDDELARQYEKHIADALHMVERHSKTIDGELDDQQAQHDAALSHYETIYATPLEQHVERFHAQVRSELRKAQ